jgi:hypothetical protein
MVHVTVTCDDCGRQDEYDLEGAVIIGKGERGVLTASHSLEYRDAFKFLSFKILNDKALKGNMN